MNRIKKYYKNYFYIAIAVFLYLYILSKLLCRIIFSDSMVTLDPSWKYAINNLDSIGLISGKNLFFTFGPLGKLLYPLGNNLYISCLFVTALYIYDCFILIKLFIKNNKSTFLNLILLFSIFIIVDSVITFIIISLCIISSAIIHSQNHYPYMAVLSVYSSLLFLMKFDLAVLSLLIILGITGTLIFSKLPIIKKYFTGSSDSGNIYNSNVSIWKTMLIFISVPVLCIIEYLIYNPSFADMLNYYRSMIMLSSDYNSAMSKGKPDSKIIILLITIVILLSIQLFSLYRKKLEFTYAIYTIPILYAYKSSLVRIDVEHRSVGPRPLLMILILSLVFIYIPYKNRSDRNPDKDNNTIDIKSYILTIVICLGIWLRVSIVAPTTDLLLVDINLPDEMINEISDHSVTAYPCDILWNSTGNFNYIGFPSLQSYVAFNPYLDEKNKEFFLSDDAPEYILFENMVIDDRLITWEAPETFKAISEGYSETGLIEIYKNKRVSLLKAVPDPKTNSLISENTYKGVFSEPIIIPDYDGHKTISFDFNKKGIYKIKNTFYRIDPFFVRIRYSDGDEKEYRFVISQASSELPLDFYIPQSGEYRITGIEFIGDDLYTLEPEFTYTIREYE